MVTYPIRVSRTVYRGADPKKRAKASSLNRVAAEIEAYINGQLQKQERPVQVYDYWDIAEATGHSIELVRDLCYSIDGGSNGFTATKPGMPFNVAMDAHLIEKQ